MTDSIRLQAPTVLAAESMNEDGRQWIHVMPTAERARNGAWYFTITSDDLETYAAFLKANAGRVPVDYDHGGSDEKGSRMTRAAGWFTGHAEIRDDGLWAEVSWTPKAQQEIRDGEFKFISPEFTFANRDEKSGLMTKAKELLAATLTNRPFFRQLNPVTAAALTDDELTNISVTYGEPVANLLTVWQTTTTDNTGGTATEEANAAMADAISALLGAVWTTAYVNDLPDSAFLYVEAGEKDEDGKTTPRSKRHFPYRDAEGKVDLPHLRNAIARSSQANLPDDVKAAVKEKAQRMLERMTAAALAAAEEEPPNDPPAEGEGGEGAEGEGAPAEESGAEAEQGEPEVPAASDPADESGDINIAEGGNMQTDSIVSALGVPEHADEATVLAAIQAKDDEIAELTEKVAGLAAKSDEAVALANRVAELEKQARAREIAIVLAEEVRTGRVAPVEVEALTKHYRDDIDGLKELVNARPIGMFAKGVEMGSGGEGPTANTEHAALARELKASDPIEPEGADLHLAALKVLAERGKADAYSADDYLSALDEASRATA